MDEFIVITQMIDNGEVIPVGSIIRGDRFVQARIEEQLRCGLIARVTEAPAETPAEAPATTSAKASAKTLPAAEA